MTKMLTREAAVERYGEIDLASAHWPDMAKWIKMLTVPAGMFPNWKVMNTQFPVTHIACNSDIHLPLLAALNLIYARNLHDQLTTFDGAFNIRMVRYSNVLMSAHSYGLAIDINARDNPLGGPVTISQELGQCFIDNGFDWGARFHRVDGMHFSRCWEGPKPAAS